MTSIRATGRTVLAPFTLVAVLAAGLLGCVPSLNPLYTADTLREDDRILRGAVGAQSAGCGARRCATTCTELATY